MDVDEQAIREIQSAWLAATADGDLAWLQPLMADDVVFLTPGRAPFGRNEFIAAFEAALGRTALKTMLPMQPGDVPATHADTALLHALTGFVPAVPVADGVRAFADWYRTEWAAIAAQA